MDTNLSREADRFPFGGGGGGNWDRDEALVALCGTTIDVGLLWKKPDVGLEDGEGV